MRSIRRLPTLPDGHETIDALRGKVVQLRQTTLPRVAAAAENTGEAVSRAALASSKHVAHALRKRQPSKSTSLATLLPLSPLLRHGVRFAARNPVVIIAAGAGLAVVGLAIWRRQQAIAAVGNADEEAGADEHADMAGTHASTKADETVREL